ncbi:PQQ-binding-like beta-propeller repeat protein [Streptomyces sp. JJ36]|uniref:outer membrane protein assembly factor BamB family protein n=1 Tax=Streptomyces sp. JJ36 TaxID=2736645 RepID=UPI001F401153|nr:PQQ-binding-like beta-propeller repeat protein [Streptomyces sp. JJ36]MCF6522255.1 PQQ-binding-like beta-propeller repeat protein [Streptomyces sp. JJ36]
MSQPPPPPPPEPPQDPQSGPSLGKQDGGYGYPQQGRPAGDGYGYPQQPSAPHAAPTQAAGFPAAQPPGQPGPPGPPPGPPGQPPTPPPGGGFGPPGAPTPPAGGYGYPAPGGPGGAPTMPPGQPPGYGQNPGMYPTMPPGGGPGGSGGNNSKIIVIVAAVVAVLLIAGGGIWFLTQGDDGGKNESKGDTKETSQGASEGGDSSGGGGGGGDTPKNADAELVAKPAAPEVSDQVSVPGTWVTEKYMVKTSVESVLGFTAEDGSEAWEIPLSGSVCAASIHQTDDDKTAIVTQETKSPDADCNQMVVLDLKQGKKVWQQTIPGDRVDVNSLGGGVTVSGDTIASAWIGGSVGYKIGGGEPIFTAKPSGTCRDEGFAGGAKLVAVVRCGSYDSPQFKVQTLDPATGKSVQEFEVPKGVESVSVASTDPLVLGVGAGTTVTNRVMTVTEDGKLGANVALGERYNKPCRTEVESCYGMAVGKDAFFLSTAEHDDKSADYGRTNEVMAFDLQTGKTKWKSDAGSKRTIVPFGMDGENVLAYKMPSYDAGGMIVSIEPSKGEQTVLMKMPSDEQLDYEQEFKPSTYGQQTEVVYGHGHLFLPELYVNERPGTFVKERLLGVGYTAR